MRSAHAEAQHRACSTGRWGRVMLAEERHSSTILVVWWGEGETCSVEEDCSMVLTVRNRLQHELCSEIGPSWPYETLTLQPQLHAEMLVLHPSPASQGQPRSLSSTQRGWRFSLNRLISF